MDWTSILHDLFAALPPTLTAAATLVVALHSLKAGKRREGKLDELKAGLGGLKNNTETSTRELITAASRDDGVDP
jgi:hypothetical protein